MNQKPVDVFSNLVEKLRVAERQRDHWKEKAQAADQSKKFTRDWYSTRWELLAEEVRKHPTLTADEKTRFFYIMANGAAGADECAPTGDTGLTPAQLLALAHHETERLEEEVEHWKRVATELADAVPEPRKAES